MSSAQIDELMEGIAIIGMAGRFPKAKNIAEFWQNLCNGVESISTFTDEDLIANGIETALLNDSNYVKSGTVLENIDLFDAAFFGFNPKEAELTDPQHRIFLECAWEALEDAGYDSNKSENRTGIYAGVGWNSYQSFNLNQDQIGSANSFQKLIGNDKDFLTTRVAYKLNLQGPSITVQTACSTSLVATNLACQSLLNYQCDMALAGGVSIRVPQKTGYLYQEGGILSPDGHCRAFDAQAKGTIIGNGVGVIVLKRLTEAIADRDHIYAIIKGSAINNDGSQKVGYTAPSIKAQAEAIAEALLIAGVEPESIGYIEAHGSGTPLGDPIEIAALSQVFRASTNQKGFCAIGSVKTNIGHLDAAAGVAGLIKTALTLKHKVIPPSLNFEQPNPEIDFANSPFYVNTQLREWQTMDTPRRAGVNSLGIGGTNVHVILEEAPVREQGTWGGGEKEDAGTRGRGDAGTRGRGDAGTRGRGDAGTRGRGDAGKEDVGTWGWGETGQREEQLISNSSLSNATCYNGGNSRNAVATQHLALRKYQLLVLSAKTSSALEAATANLSDYLHKHPDSNLADVAYTLQVGRRHFNYRRTVVCRDVADAAAALSDQKRVLTSFLETQQRPVALMFPGLGTHYVNMGWELYQAEPTFRASVDYCCEFLKPLLGEDLRDVLYAKQPSNSAAGIDLRRMLGRTEQQPDAATQKLNQTFLTQPAIFVTEYALAQLWLNWGIHPVAMIGYSIGEYVAATLAGVLSVEEALSLVAKRAQMIQELPGGAMLAVTIAESDVYPLLNEKLSLSAINGSSVCVISGSINAIEELEQRLLEQGLVCRRVETSHAFHSQMMEAIAPSFYNLVATFNLQPPKIPYISNVTGTWITPGEATDPNYWVKHLCQAVRFADGIKNLWQKQNPILLEVGAGQILGSFALQCLENQQGVDKIVLPSLRYAYDCQSDVAFLLNTLGQLWLAGVEIDWSQFYRHQRCDRISLPTYPFERQRYWIEPQTSHININQNLPAQRLGINQWFHLPSWKRAAPPQLAVEKLINNQQSWLVFIDACAVGWQIKERLERENQDVIIVRIGEQFSKLSEREYKINPSHRDDYDTLLRELRLSNKTPNTIVHLWNINEQIKSGLKYWGEIQNLGFWSLLFLAQALGDANINNAVQIDVISNNLQELTDSDKLCPEKATLLGPCKVIPQEYSHITCRSIDITLPQLDTKQWQQLIEQLFTELTNTQSESIIAYRGNRRWVQCFEQLPVASKTLCTPKLRRGGVYMITGGLGGIGLAIAQYLAKLAPVKIVLIGRSKLPAKAQWQQWLSDHDEEDVLSQKIKKIQELEKLGAEVVVIAADVAHLEQMQTTVNQVCDRFGKIHGVIHAAGVPGAGLMQLKTTELAESVLHPKVRGTLVLNTVLKDIKLDFLVLFSSMTSMYGGFGQVDYCAANAFLDAFAHDNFYKREIPTISINWDWWQWDNWQDALLSFAPEIQANFKQMREQYGITFAEGVNTLGHVLSLELPQVIVTTRNLQDVIDEHENFEVSHLWEKSLSNSKHLRPNLKTTYVAPSGEIECKVAQRYQELLGIEQVGIYDHFFDLGGNSLIGTQLIFQLRKDFQIELSTRLIFEASSVSALALVIEEVLIAELEKLSEDEADKLLSTHSK
ncbi:MAG: SDR family NAD(P)-dependent oxidoreductase [Desmonostoc vinosum HA7617-LM4]|jgi:acyl transferase domain-containing protein/acyl carrier protein|nr:SDR family NAD(P)-dependent oxidoreductase [Desmonostoc vinosum HA7617-LM4]